jgi:integrase
MPAHNACRARRLTSPEPSRVRRLSPSTCDLRAKLAGDKRAVGWDLPEFVDVMLATGLRIGEASAMTWAAVDLEAETVEVRGTVIRVKGQGLVIKPKPKSKAGYRKLLLPSWAVAMLRRRRTEAIPNDWDVVFTAPLGGLRDPSNTQADLRSVLSNAGYEWVTSHTFRKTAATLLEGAGLTVRAVADQLGHADVTTTQNHYFGRKMTNDRAAAVLEAIGIDAEGCG